MHQGRTSLLRSPSRLKVTIKSAAVSWIGHVSRACTSDRIISQSQSTTTRVTKYTIFSRFQVLAQSAIGSYFGPEIHPLFGFGTSTPNSEFDDSERHVYPKCPGQLVRRCSYSELCGSHMAAVILWVYMTQALPNR